MLTGLGKWVRVQEKSSLKMMDPVLSLSQFVNFSLIKRQSLHQPSSQWLSVNSSVQAIYIRNRCECDKLGSVHHLFSIKESPLARLIPTRPTSLKEEGIFLAGVRLKRSTRMAQGERKEDWVDGNGRVVGISPITPASCLDSQSGGRKGPVGEQQT